MPYVIVERAPSEPFDLQAADANERAGHACLALHGVSFRYGFVADDLFQTFCLYEGPDAESVRYTQRAVGNAFVRAWKGELVGGPATPGPAVMIEGRVHPESVQERTLISAPEPLVSFRDGHGRTLDAYRSAPPPLLPGEVRRWTGFIVDAETLDAQAAERARTGE